MPCRRTRFEVVMRPILSIPITLLTALLIWQGPRYLRATCVLTDTMGLEDPTGLTHWVTHDIVSEEQTLRFAEPMEVIVHRPLGGPTTQGILLVHGIHPLGMREPRLQRLARALAHVGNVVMTPSLPELARLSATPQSIERIKAAAAALARQVHHPILAIGISVGGGLTLMAAASQGQDGPIGQVAAIGAHHDLVRVAMHYAGVVAKDANGTASTVAPHHYGIQVLARAHANRLFAPEDAALASDILQRYLQQKYREARAEVPRLSPEGQTLMTALLDQPSGPLVHRRLQGAIAQIEPELRQVSPASHLAGLRVPVLLLHGVADPVIPPGELSWIAREVPPHLLKATLVTPVLTHADFPDDAEPADFAHILKFVAELLPPL